MRTAPVRARFGSGSSRPSSKRIMNPAQASARTPTAQTMRPASAGPSPQARQTARAARPLRSAGWMTARGQRADDSSALDQVAHRQDHGEDQEEMDEPTGDVEREETESPRDQQHQRDRQKHGSFSL